ncbi:MAG TPA: tRNA (adenosine(37)-N6)-threonylcarbamoyltransferase complex ATPase subunit type 1 TsaE [Tepidisphaeraceae bacterium]|nr:tRNA (adenosine(37)-N6)-threonylcarbamoyltransferase complex ATPase subunit type 1 TsaE [Tepidisphaeraceae bacterium]
MVYHSCNLSDTEGIAGQVAKRLRPGDCIALDGELGAGKTQFVRGLVRALGGDARSVSSPTYVLLHIYACADVQMFHLDAYRVAGADDLEAIGFTELLAQGGITVVEWAARVRDILPEQTIHIRITAIDESSRRIEVVE